MVGSSPNWPGSGPRNLLGTMQPSCHQALEKTQPASLEKASTRPVGTGRPAASYVCATSRTALLPALEVTLHATVLSAALTAKSVSPCWPVGTTHAGARQRGAVQAATPEVHPRVMRSKRRAEGPAARAALAPAEPGRATFQPAAQCLRRCSAACSASSPSRAASSGR